MTTKLRTYREYLTSSRKWGIFSEKTTHGERIQVCVAGGLTKAETTPEALVAALAIYRSGYGSGIAEGQAIATADLKDEWERAAEIRHIREMAARIMRFAEDIELEGYELEKKGK